MIFIRLINLRLVFQIWVRIIMRRVANYVGVPSIMSSRSTDKIVIISIQMSNLSSNSHPTPCKLFMRSLRTKWCPAPSSQLKLTHHPWRILVISQRCRKQTFPRVIWSRIRTKLQFFLHLLLRNFCFSTWQLIKALWLLQTRIEILIKPPHLLASSLTRKTLF